MNKYTFNQVTLGQQESFSVTITDSMMQQFNTITADNNLLHNDENFAKSKGYPGKVVYGFLTASFLSTLAGVYLPGEKSLIQSVEVKFLSPVFVGDTLNVTGTVIEKHDSFEMFVMQVSIVNQEEKRVLKGKMQIGMK